MILLHVFTYYTNTQVVLRERESRHMCHMEQIWKSEVLMIKIESLGHQDLQHHSGPGVDQELIFLIIPLTI